MSALRRGREPYRPLPFLEVAGLVVAVALSGGGALAAQQAVRSPHGTLPEGLECSACHTAEGWQTVKKPLGFKHGEKSGFVLTGAHREVACASCHTDLRFDKPLVAPDECGSCHTDVHQGQMLQTCATCHTTNSFRDVDGERIHARTAFPLTGAHRQVTCESCHVTDAGGAFTRLDPDCMSCHEKDYRGARAVDHVAAGYPTTCTVCHGTLSWRDTQSFDHVMVSNGFALRGAHTRLECASCHRTGDMAPLFQAANQDDCVACHQGDFDREHSGTKFPTTCLSCHTVETWSDVSGFDHALTGFQLVGAHAAMQCTSCHTSDGKKLLFPTPADANDCASCHQADYDRQHSGSGFPTTCLSCHTQSSWQGATFDHASTGFPLVGAHISVSCATCHGSNPLAALPSGPTDCVACHQKDYDGQHAGSGFPTTCLSCHNQSGWGGANLDHTAVSGGFALSGPHATAACTSCHAVPGYTLLFPKPANNNDCVACHQADYDRQHAGSGFPTTCLSCHQPDTWTGATVDHAAISGGFALQGAHATVACTACHAVPGYTLLFPKPASPNDCVTCHQSQYDQAHGGQGYPTTCSSCHTVNAWSPSTFNHDSQYFPIYSGTHRGRWSNCATCHTVPSDFSSFSCIVCHEHSRSNTDGHHNEVGGYVYSATSCYACHRNGQGG